MGFTGEKVEKKVEKIGLIIDYLRENEEAFNSMEKWQILQTLDNEYFELHNHICLQLYDELGLLDENCKIIDLVRQMI